MVFPGSIWARRKKPGTRAHCCSVLRWPIHACWTDVMIPRLVFVFWQIFVFRYYGRKGGKEILAPKAPPAPTVDDVTKADCMPALALYSEESVQPPTAQRDWTSFWRKTHVLNFNMIPVLPKSTCENNHGWMHNCEQVLPVCMYIVYACLYVCLFVCLPERQQILLYDFLHESTRKAWKRIRSRIKPYQYYNQHHQQKTSQRKQHD